MPDNEGGPYGGVPDGHAPDPVHNLMAATTPGPDSDIGRLEQALSSIVVWFARNDVYQQIMRRARCDLPRAPIVLLSRIDLCGTARLSELTPLLGVDKSTLTPQAKRLIRDGLIERDADPDDQRAAQLRVTSAGRDLLARLHATRRAMLTEMLADWPAADQARMADLITQLATALDSDFQAAAGLPTRPGLSS